MSRTFDCKRTVKIGGAIFVFFWLQRSLMFLTRISINRDDRLDKSNPTGAGKSGWDESHLLTGRIVNYQDKSVL